jgi:MFS family permease
MVSALWLAAAQGLTQGVFFRYQVGVLKLPLEAYLALGSLMYLLQVPFSWLGGWLSDQYGDRRPLMTGIVLVSGAMGFWMLARPGAAEWLLGAYSLWGLFGLVNVCQRNLLLKSAPSSDNAFPLSMLEHVAGLIAGLSGILGGWLLMSLLEHFGDSRPLAPYLLLFAVSWIGRFTAAGWLIERERAPRGGDARAPRDAAAHQPP